MTIIRDPRTNIKLKDSTGTGAKYLDLSAGKWVTNAANATVFETSVSWKINTSGGADKYMDGVDTNNTVTTSTTQDTDWQRDWGDTNGAPLSHGSKYLGKDGSDNAVLSTSSMNVYYEEIL